MVNYQEMLQEQFDQMALILVDVTKLLAIICVPGFGGHSVCHKTMMRNEPLSTVVEMHFLFFFIF